ncbi:DinB family protein [Thalassospira lucentensis]|uniref:DinB family protein n=1 Tax=Thalassospira lucentensis TaxID=168935 RepID=UPI00142D3BFD|nr:DinB family protein [Thalassospira lucentensis]NIZ00495.1 damage-inducible protein DinB [Thalassospira lucentensis]
MNGVAYFKRMAGYNRWANGHVYNACAALPEDALYAPRTAFFPSIMRTLNHLLVADRLWLSRLLGAPEVMPLDTVLFDAFDDLRAARTAQDQAIIDFATKLTEELLSSDLSYQSVSGGANVMPRDVVLGHMFNHQTHHRGQLSSMVLEAGGKPLEIDFIYYLRETAL